MKKAKFFTLTMLTAISLAFIFGGCSSGGGGDGGGRKDDLLANLFLHLPHNVP